MSTRNWRQRLGWLGAIALISSAAVAACGDDDATSGPTPTGDAGQDGTALDTGSPDANGTDGPANTDGGSDAVSDAPINVDLDAPGDDVEAATRQDAAVIEAGAKCPGVNQCDCDNDGYEAEGGTCLGNDCNDRDPLRHPNQTYVEDPPDPGTDGNWNCVGGVEKQYTTNLSCAALLGLNCNSTAQGFIDDPGCGVEDDYYQCTPGLLSCTAQKMGKRRQGCK